MNAQQLKELLYKYQSGTCTHKEKEKLHQYFDSFQDDHDIWSEIKDKESIRIEIFNQLNHRIDSASSAPVQNRKPYWGIAASILLFIATGLYFLFTADSSSKVQDITTHATVAGQKTTVILPDGSTVYLNAASSLTYAPQFNKNRTLTLVGEAFFDVKRDPDHPFQVQTGKLTTKVLGTSFNIHAYQNQKNIVVSVATGKVEVLSEKQTKQLIQGQQITYETGGILMSLEKVDVSRITAWKDGVIVIDGLGLVEIFERLEKWYGVNFLWQQSNASNCDLKLTFDNLTLVQALDQLRLVAGIDYAFVDQKTIQITGNGCVN